MTKYLKKPSVLILSFILTLNFTYSCFAVSSFDKLYSKGIIHGYPDGNLHIDKPLTRAEFITIINKAMDYKDDDQIIEFLDVPKNPWYLKDLKIAVKEKYILGYPNKTFKPNKTISYGEVSCIIYGILKNRNYKPNKNFKNQYFTYHWAKDYVNYLISIGIFNNVEIKNLDSPVKREYAFLIIENLLNLQKNNEKVPDTNKKPDSNIEPKINSKSDSKIKENLSSKNKQNNKKKPSKNDKDSDYTKPEVVPKSKLEIYPKDLNIVSLENPAKITAKLDDKPVDIKDIEYLISPIKIDEDLKKYKTENIKKYKSPYIDKDGNLIISPYESAYEIKITAKHKNGSIASKDIFIANPQLIPSSEPYFVGGKYPLKIKYLGKDISKDENLKIEIEENIPWIKIDSGFLHIKFNGKANTINLNVCYLDDDFSVNTNKEIDIADKIFELIPEKNSFTPGEKIKLSAFYDKKPEDLKYVEFTVLEPKNTEIKLEDNNLVIPDSLSCPSIKIKACYKNIFEDVIKIEKMPIEEENPVDNFKYEAEKDFVKITEFIPEEANTVIIPEKINGLPVRKIYEDAFKKKRIHTLKLPESLETINKHSFREARINTLKLPESLRNINLSAIFDAIIETIDLPKNINNVNSNAFDDCIFKEMTIQNNIDIFDMSAFNNTKIHKLKIDNQDFLSETTNTKFLNCCIIGLEFSDECDCIEENSFRKIHIEHVTLPTSIKSIGDRAFLCSHVKTLALNEGLESIGKLAFVQNFITNLTIPSSVKKIDEMAFHLCGIKELTLNEGIKYIGKSAFENNRITTITIPSSIEIFGEQAFLSCDLETVKLKDGLKYISKSAFENNELTSVTIPSSIEIIEDNAFYKCKIEKLELKEGLKSIGNSAFANNKMESVTIPSSVETIGENAFYSCEINNLELHEGLKSIGNSAFANNKLKSVTIPSSVETIGENCFAENEELKEVSIDSKTKYQENSFSEGVKIIKRN